MTEFKPEKELFDALPQEEKERLAFKQYQWQNRIGTHGPGCWKWGPSHYHCVCRELEHAVLAFHDMTHFVKGVAEQMQDDIYGENKCMP